LFRDNRFMSESEGVRFVVDGAVATVTLCSPERRNAQSPAMWARLVEIGQGLSDDVRVVVLRAEGVSFSAGLDLRMLTGDLPGAPGLAELAGREDADLVIAEYQRAFTWWRDVRPVTIAVVDGHAVGAGFQLALACDIRIASTDAMFAMKEVVLGLVPDLAGTSRLIETVGYARALEWCATGRVVTAPEALASGLVSRVVEPHELDGAVDELVGRLLAADADTGFAIKDLLRDAERRSATDQQARERAAQLQRLQSLARRNAV